MTFKTNILTCSSRSDYICYLQVSAVAQVTHNVRLVSQGAVTLNFTGERSGSC
jgi:hypothetical protein